MRTTGTLAAIAAISVLAFMPLASFADGAAIAKDKCAACHGDDGNSADPKVPSIAGFSAITITDMLEEYRSGDRKGDKYKPEGGDETDMNAVTKELSESDSEAVAEFYAGKKFKMQTNEVNAKLAKKGRKIHDKKCEKCHSEGGSLPDDDAALLAGQWKDYLVKEFGKLSNDERPMPKKMKKKFKKLNDAQKAALIEFYAGGGK